MLCRTKPKNTYLSSKAMVQSIAPAIEKLRFHTLNDSMVVLKTPRRWYYDQSRTIRFMAIKPNHAPHFMEDMGSLPWHAFGWKEGQTLAYVIYLIPKPAILYWDTGKATF